MEISKPKENFLLRLFDQPVVNVLLGALSRQHRQEFAQVVGRDIQSLSHVLNRGQAVSGDGVTLKIIGEQLLKAVQNSMVGDLSRDELAAEEPLGVGEKEFDPGDDDVLAEGVASAPLNAAERNPRSSMVPIAALARMASISPFLSGLLLTTLTSCPVCTSFCVNGLPMWPKDPVKTIFIVSSLLCFENPQ